MTITVKHITTYCKYSGIVCAVSPAFSTTTFSNKFYKAQHPVLDLAPTSLLKLAAECAKLGHDSVTNEEKHLLLVAYLKSVGLLHFLPDHINQRTQPLVLDWTSTQSPKLWRTLLEFIRDYSQAQQNNSFIPEIPQLVVGGSEQVTIGKCIQYLIEAVRSIKVYSGLGRTLTKAEKLDDELSLEQEIKNMLRSYDSASNKLKYSPAIGKWCVNYLLEDPSVSLPEVEAIEKALALKDLYRVKADWLRKVLSLMKNILPMDTANRVNSLLCVKQIQTKLETLGVLNSNSGLIILGEEDFSIEGEEGITIKSRSKMSEAEGTARTNNPEGIKTAMAQAPQNSALARLLAKHLAATTAATTEE